jgi:hypothetical protein
MSKPANKKAAPAPKRREKAINKKRPQPTKDRGEDSDDIERAVYDGMQDLRVTKPRSRKQR